MSRFLGYYFLLALLLPPFLIELHINLSPAFLTDLPIVEFGFYLLGCYVQQILHTLRLTNASSIAPTPAYPPSPHPNTSSLVLPIFFSLAVAGTAPFSPYVHLLDISHGRTISVLTVCPSAQTCPHSISLWCAHSKSSPSLVFLPEKTSAF